VDVRVSYRSRSGAILAVVTHACLAAFVVLDVVGPSLPSIRHGNEGELRLGLVAVVAVLGAASALARCGRSALKQSPALQVAIVTAVASMVLFAFAEEPRRALLLGAAWATAVYVAGSAGFSTTLLTGWRTASLACASVAAIGLVQGTLGVETATDSEATRFGFARLSGITWHPNAQAMLGVIAVLGAIWPRNRAVLIPERMLVGSIGVAAIVWAQSQTAVLAIAVALFAEVIRLASSRWRAVIGLVVAALGLAAFLAGPTDIATELSRTQRAHKTETLNGRTVLWEATYEVVKEHPINGLGMGSAGLGGSARESSPHNLVADVALEWGLVGLIGLLTGAVLIVRQMGNGRWRSVGPMSGLACVLMLTPTTGMPPTGVIALFALASTLVSSSSSGVQTRRAV